MVNYRSNLSAVAIMDGFTNYVFGRELTVSDLEWKFNGDTKKMYEEISWLSQVSDPLCQVLEMSVDMPGDYTYGVDYEVGNQLAMFLEQDKGEYSRTQAKLILGKVAYDFFASCSDEDKSKALAIITAGTGFEPENGS